MAKKAKTIDLLGAFSELEEARNVDNDVILAALTKAIEDAFKKTFANYTDPDNVTAYCNIDPEKGSISLTWVRKVVEQLEDEMDKPFDIGFEEAKGIKAKIKVGDNLETPVDISTFNIETVRNVKTIFTQIIKEKEKEKIYDAFSSLKGHLMSAQVEKIEDKYVIFKIGNTLAYMPKNEMIPGEEFKIGDVKKVYIKDVTKDAKKLPITVSRSDASFLMKLFSLEVPEIESGDVYVRMIARIPGIRSKVAVCSKGNIKDAAGACIGQNGVRIAAIANELQGEKIDVINYYDDSLRMIQECLRPADVQGIGTKVAKTKVKQRNPETGRVEEVEIDAKIANVVVSNDTVNLAIGVKGQNIFLAKRASKYDIIQIYDVDTALQEHVVYTRMDQIIADYNVAHNIETTAKKVAHYVDDDGFETEIPSMETKQEAPVEEAVNETVETTVEETPVEVKKDVYVGKTHIKGEHISVVEEEKPVEIKASEEEASGPSKKSIKREEEAKAKAKLEEVKNKFQPIYTEEELAEIEAEEEDTNSYEEEEDFSEYDSYYDEY